MIKQIIQQPDNVSITTKNMMPGENAKSKIHFIWKNNFSIKYNKNLHFAQKYVDQACIRYMDPLTPMITGKLKESVVIGSKIGSGRLVYANPYARYDYYGKLMVSAKTGSAYAAAGEKKVLTNIDLKYNHASHPQAGPFWFERMKKSKAKIIRKGAEKIMRGEKR